MNDTPKKNNTNPKENKNSGFSPIILPQSPAAGSPQKNLTGPPRIAKDIVANLYNNIQHWNDDHIKGAQIVKQIAVLKSNDPKNYSLPLEAYINDLYNVFQSLINHVKCFETLIAQIAALAKLQKKTEPLFVSLDAISIANLVETVANAYREEIKIKNVVLENIAHSKNRDEAMFFAACWTFQTHITSIINLKLEALLVEMGHRNLT
ncbi:hypothetical protein NQ314_010288 [Rhamnusium bicolor]|uniref:Uncharacterized protein n=1 Tax=Rhamnusium bicolor TaxID=1586634 RepID=A0AAV8XSS9_9CUCU|nr:hypothetical protein NQ314_010288 [Rhamnusium bicolor]